MLKRILGDDNGLSLSLNKSPVYLCPSKKSVIEITANNTTEYDMHLFLSFGAVSGVTLQNSEPDFFIPAQGKSVFTLMLSVSENEKLYMGTSILDFKVTDRVLEWQQEYELCFFTENGFTRCDGENDYSPDEQMLFSRQGIIYLSENENACLQAACTEEKTFLFQYDGTAELYVNGNLCQNDKFTLQSGLNKICISCKNDGAFWFAEIESEKKTCLNTINPKFFL